ncbi:GFA family protein [Halomonas sp. McH1-25]|uniref:GFA family protein n=1 Tax=unclassified Halomonas TaxID=2609666 RepID=UPI001EF5DC9C|nr:MULTISPECIES: GFA family protein [unclassified Halomonas]MCG7600268.1 GFA family protein [Halomonas sp. McH1-25]MCP1343416.1 GFA family protein [Halomonas sp. FL8]MCP1359619.1 GFA family protein [Halomonas sp. BBD45]
MQLDGSCHCGAVHFSVDADAPYPFNLCYCSICRKTAGTGGFAINLGAKADTLKIEGEEHINTYRAHMEDGSISSAERRFCRECGTALWLWSPEWPELVHPHAGAIDTPLPVPPEHTHMMLGSKPDWVLFRPADGDRCFQEYPDESLAQWHERVAGS